MLSRASRPKINQNVYKQLHLTPNDLYLPWLCPALYTEKHHRQRSSAVVPLRTAKHARPALPELRRSIRSSQCENRGLASATAFDYVSPTNDYVPFEGELRQAFQFPWMPPDKAAVANHFDTDPPLIINDSLTTRPPRFRSFDAITGELSDIVSTMKACLHVGRYERAAALMRRLNSIYKPDAPALLAAHNDYIREVSWKIVTTRDQQLLRDLQTWFEVELRGRGILPDAMTYALMIQAVLQDVSVSKSSRSLRRYLHLAEEAGLQDNVKNALFTVLNEQDFGRVTRVRGLSHVYCTV